LLDSYGFFLSISKPTMAIAMIMAITPIPMYIVRSEAVAQFAAILHFLGAAVCGGLFFAFMRLKRAAKQIIA